ncbi:uncharacterized protein G2W53_034018 [Senna tora]|uniref:Uncharacterized protein n=1 Tax=Senna tora TaxID=362788 RepID=A0A834T193_9FABA|nr:uncharacterized protein G2W53_034018 [Senna tora]
MDDRSIGLGITVSPSRLSSSQLTHMGQHVP